METKEENTRQRHVLDWCWRQQMLVGMPKSTRDAFNAGYSFGFIHGRKHGRKEALGERQLKIPGT